jgi:hypothetical protein
MTQKSPIRISLEFDPAEAQRMIALNSQKQFDANNLTKKFDTGL